MNLYWYYFFKLRIFFQSTLALKKKKKKWQKNCKVRRSKSNKSEVIFSFSVLSLKNLIKVVFDSLLIKSTELLIYDSLNFYVIEIKSFVSRLLSFLYQLLFRKNIHLDGCRKRGQSASQGLLFFFYG